MPDVVDASITRTTATRTTTVRCIARRVAAAATVTGRATRSRACRSADTCGPDGAVSVTPAAAASAARAGTGTTAGATTAGATIAADTAAGVLAWRACSRIGGASGRVPGNGHRDVLAADGHGRGVGHRILRDRRWRGEGWGVVTRLSGDGSDGRCVLRDGI
ncbi:hypothetical protein [Burkholderia ubonensis]|uniref:hypothetical protein n=1 Tax=Burkholderia ubonensis TaxID=101571 RepID=UPI0018DF12BA|nr:hypothetical protein [Burkholderia ubonensis]